MNREIEFRAWDKLNNEMFYPTRINFFLLNQLSKYSDGSGELSGKDSVLMQYTGLRDRNGVKIFEGDICKNGDWVEDAQAYVYRIEEIKYNEQEACFSGWNWNEDGMTCEVIGNVFENPELLNPTTPA